MNDRSPTCESCGAPACVHITGEPGARGRVRSLCLSCAEAEETKTPRRGRSLNRSAVLMATGAVALFLSVFADRLAFGGREGFGWRQLSGLVIAAILIGAGGALQIRTVFVVGLIAAVLAFLADWLGFGNAPGFGRQQVLGTALGILLLALGIALPLVQKLTRHRGHSENKPGHR